VYGPDAVGLSFGGEIAGVVVIGPQGFRSRAKTPHMYRPATRAEHPCRGSDLNDVVYGVLLF
jgi:hypothetical protein